jgi:lysophospholipase L1-like esterase
MTVPVPDVLIEPAYRSGLFLFNTTTNDIGTAYVKDNADAGPYADANDVHKFDGATHNTVILGDSISRGATATLPYGLQLMRLLKARGILSNYKIRAINGQGLGYVFAGSQEFGTLNADAATSVDAARNPALQNRLIIMGGSNDVYLDAQTGAATYTRLTTNIDARIAAGWPASEIYVVTMLPRQLNNAERGNYNTAIMNDAGGRGYRKVPVHLNASIGLDGCQNNASLFSDTIHPTNAGHVILAAEINAVYVA